MQLAIGLYPGFTALDAIGPYQVFVNMPDVEVVLCAAESGPLVDENKLLYLDINHTFDEVNRPDIVFVPGSGVAHQLARNKDPIVDWIRHTHATSRYTTSVCTGALLLGAAGVLDGLSATTHWASYEALRSYGAHPTASRVVKQGKVITGAGVSAGIDMALSLVAETHGPLIAQTIQLSIEYDPSPPFDSGSPAKAPANVRMLAGASIAVNHMRGESEPFPARNRPVDNIRSLVRLIQAAREARKHKR